MDLSLVNVVKRGEEARWVEGKGGGGEAAGMGHA